MKVLKALPYKPEHPPRPGFGTLGTAITVRANFFPVKFERQILYDYAISITPDKYLKGRRERLFTLLEQCRHPQWLLYAKSVVHDKGARLVSAKELPQSLEIPVPFLEEGQSQPSSSAETYVFSFKLQRELDPHELIM